MNDDITRNNTTETPTDVSRCAFVATGQPGRVDTETERKSRGNTLDR
jgi:hypothetical protein